MDSDQLLEYRFQVGVESGQETPDSISLSDVLLTFRAFDEVTRIQESEIRSNLRTHASNTIVAKKAGILGVADGVFLVLRARFD